jgi:large subunit ribosomal protein L18
MSKLSRNQKRLHRKRRVRIKVSGTSQRPRLCVFRSLNVIYGQLIDDQQAKTLVATDSRSLKSKKFDQETAKETGKQLAKLAQEKKIKEVVFDRGGYLYHGKVRALAEGAREGGLKF